MPCMLVVLRQGRARLNVQVLRFELSVALLSLAEATGLVVGVLALAGLFNNTLECFRIIQLDRAFENDFKPAQLNPDICLTLSFSLGCVSWTSIATLYSRPNSVQTCSAHRKTSLVLKICLTG